MVPIYSCLVVTIGVGHFKWKQNHPAENKDLRMTV